MRKLFISIAGTMGVGKTTAAKLLARELSYHLLEENFADNTFLPRFYKDMSRWAFHSQTFFLMEKIRQMHDLAVILNEMQNPVGISNSDGILRQAQDDKINGVIQDTPIYQDVFSYAKALYKQGRMETEEWELYFRIYLTSAVDLPKPDYIIFLEAEVDEIARRIQARERTFENSVTRDYLVLLDKLNREWLEQLTDGTRVIRVNTDNLNLVKNKADMKKFLGAIQDNLQFT